jgi:hypothetical protein
MRLSLPGVFMRHHALRFTIRSAALSFAVLGSSGCGGKGGEVSTAADASTDGKFGDSAIYESSSSGSSSSSSGAGSSGTGSSSSGIGAGDASSNDASGGSDGASTVDGSSGDALSGASGSSSGDASSGDAAGSDASANSGDASSADAGLSSNDASSADAPSGSDSARSDDASSSGPDGGSDAMSGTCGTTGLACCPGDQCTDTELWCVAGVCSPCGSSGQPCCGVDCNSGNVCIATSERSECMACGGPGQVCCTSLPECQNEASGYGCWSWGLLENCLNVPAAISTGVTGEPGEECSSTCSDPADTCFLSMTSMNAVGPDPFCVTCGNLDLPCCDGTTCETGLSCGSSGYCE